MRNQQDYGYPRLGDQTSRWRGYDIDGHSGNWMATDVCGTVGYGRTRNRAVQACKAQFRADADAKDAARAQREEA